LLKYFYLKTKFFRKSRILLFLFIIFGSPQKNSRYQKNSPMNIATHADFLEGLPLGDEVVFRVGGWGGGAPYP